MADHINVDFGDESTTTISPYQIRTCENVAQLTAWMTSLEDLDDSLTSQIEARMQADIDDDDWLTRVADSLGYTKRAQRMIKRRLTAIGCPYEPNPQVMIKRLNDTLRFERASHAYFKTFHKEAKTVMKVAEFEEINRRIKSEVREPQDAVGIAA